MNDQRIVELLDRMERQLVDLQASLGKAQELVKELGGPGEWDEEMEAQYRWRHQQ